MDLKVCVALLCAMVASGQEVQKFVAEAQVQKPQLVNESLYPTGCACCNTCGGSYPYYITTIASGWTSGGQFTWFQYGSGCSGSAYSYTGYSPYVCCSYYTGVEEPAREIEEAPKEPATAAVAVPAKKEKKEVAALATTADAKMEGNATFTSSCLICNTCGSSWTVLHAVLYTAAWYEFSGGCSGSYPAYVSSDNAYVCCNYYADAKANATQSVLI